MVLTSSLRFVEFEPDHLYIIATLPPVNAPDYTVDYTEWSLVVREPQGTLHRYRLEHRSDRWVIKKNANWHCTDEVCKEICLIYCFAVPGRDIDSAYLDEVCSTLSAPADCFSTEWVTKRWIQKVIVILIRYGKLSAMENIEDWFRRVTEQIYVGMESRARNGRWPRYVIHSH